jgi:alkylation response protein AidB-like acyl-CoA dehydrogenase
VSNEPEPGTGEMGALAVEIFTADCPPDEVRRLMGTELGYDREVWRGWATKSGLAGLAVPEEYGGGGFSLAVLSEVFEAAGHTLACAPLLATSALAAPLLLAAGDADAAGRWLPRLCAGELTATVAGTEATGPGVRAVVGPDRQWSLTGQVERVVDGASADLILVIARTDDGPGVFEVTTDPAPAGLSRTTLMSLDLTRRQATLRFDGVPAARIGPLGEVSRIESALDVGRAMLAAELVGTAQRCLDLTVSYTRGRLQFGQPIGAFQAVKQRAAEMLIRIELARSAARFAAQAFAGHQDWDEPGVPVALAKAYCAEAATSVAQDAIQLHGGIGFTWEHEVHLHLKRAITDDELLGAASTHWATLSGHLDRVL